MGRPRVVRKAGMWRSATEHPSFHTTFSILWRGGHGAIALKRMWRLRKGGDALYQLEGEAGEKWE